MENVDEAVQATNIAETSGKRLFLMLTFLSPQKKLISLFGSVIIHSDNWPCCLPWEGVVSYENRYILSSLQIKWCSRCLIGWKDQQLITRRCTNTDVEFVMVPFALKHNAELNV